MSVVHTVVQLTSAAAPLGLAVLFDHDLSSAAHLPVIGVAGICVSLCDALCGQIISNTRWIPFSASHTPAEAQQLVRMFRRYHREMILTWMAAKCASATVVALSAVMALQGCPTVLAQNKFLVFSAGYVLLGVSVCMAVRFVFSYFSAMDESDKARLREMNYAYVKDHPEVFAEDSETVKRQLVGFASGYTSAPSVAEAK